MTLLKGAREIRTGKKFCLSLPLDLPGGSVLNPRRHPPQLSPTKLKETAYLNFPLRTLNPDAVDVLSDDQILLSMQYSTQWDSLAHVGALFDADGSGQPQLCYYNGFLAGVDVIAPQDGDHAGCGCNSGGPSAALKFGAKRHAKARRIARFATPLRHWSHLDRLRGVNANPTGRRHPDRIRRHAGAAHRLRRSRHEWSA